MIDDQIQTAREMHQELKEYLIYRRYITPEDIEVFKEVAEDEAIQISRSLFNLTISQDELHTFRAAVSATSTLQNRIPTSPYLLTADITQGNGSIISQPATYLTQNSQSP